MKKLLFSVGVVAFFIACNNNPKTETPTTIVDTTNRIQIDKNQAVDMKGVNSDTIIGSDGQVYIKSKPNDPIPQPPVQSAPVRHNVAHQPVHTIKHHSSGSGTSTNPGSGTSNGGSGSSTTNSGSGTSTGAGTGVGTGTTGNQTPAPVEEPKKKGWSNAAKGAAIGGASGAVIGAVVSKNKGLGAVIGGVVGAGGGYLFGKSKDKKKKQQADSTATGQ